MTSAANAAASISMAEPAGRRSVVRRVLVAETRTTPRGDDTELVRHPNAIGDDHDEDDGKDESERHACQEQLSCQVTDVAPTDDSSALSLQTMQPAAMSSCRRHDDGVRRWLDREAQILALGHD